MLISGVKRNAMYGYDPQAIVNSYTACDEAYRLGRSADTQIMFEIEKWFIETYCPSSGMVIDVGAGPYFPYLLAYC